MPAEGVTVEEGRRYNARSKASFSSMPTPSVVKAGFQVVVCCGKLCSKQVGIAVIRFRIAAVQPRGVETHRCFRAEAGQ